MNEQTIGVSRHTLRAKVHVNHFPLVVASVSKRSWSHEDVKDLSANVIESDVILKTDHHSFKLIVAWSCDRNQRVMPHSMLGAAIANVSSTREAPVGEFKLKLVNHNPSNVSAVICSGLSVHDIIGWYPSPHATSRANLDGFVLLTDVLDSSKGWLNDGTLTVECSLTLGTLKPHPVQYRIVPYMKARDELSTQFGALLETSRGADVMVVVGQDRILVHSIILSARSPVFDAMWSHPMKEKEEKQVTIDDLEPSAVRSMLQFMYTGKTDTVLGNDGETVSLLQVAHKYQMPVLKDACVAALVSKLTNESAIEHLVYADLAGIEALKQKCLQFITSSSDKLAAIQGTDGFAQLSEKQPHLLGELLAAAFPPAAGKRRRC